MIRLKTNKSKKLNYKLKN